MPSARNHASLGAQKSVSTEDIRELPRAEQFSARLKSRNFKHVLRTTPGAHTWMVWRSYFHKELPLLINASR